MTPHRQRCILAAAVTLLLLAYVRSPAQSPIPEVAISEFMAMNVSTLTNSLGETSDWVELYNAETSTVDVTGWYLTDNDGDPTRWQFPPAQIAPRDFLLVYASGIDTAQTNGELHANFKLDPDGEYLALVYADGTTVVSEFAPAYPSQVADVSFGLRPDITEMTLVHETDSFRYRVASDASVDATWMSPTNFDDSGWATGIPAIGYELPGTNFASLLNTRVPVGATGVYVRCSFIVDTPESFGQLALRARFDDGLVVYVNGEKALTENAPANPTSASTAGADRDLDDALGYDLFDLSSHAEFVHEGTNVLAVHVLNANTSPRNSDLLLAARLEGAVFRPGLADEPRFFHAPTPGAQNQLGEEDYLKKVDFSVKRGFYDTPFDLVLTPPMEDCEIRYTTDGTTPTESHGTLYTGPIDVRSNRAVRARAFKKYFEASAARTHTYLFPDEIFNHPKMNTAVVNHPEYGPQLRASLMSLRTVSFVTAHSNLFDAAYGIYMNPLASGVEWERPLSMEWIDPFSGDNTQIDCGVRIYGGWARRRERKPFRVLFKTIYGPSEFTHEVFRGYKTATDTFNTIIFRADGAGNPFTTCGIIDPFVRDTQIAMSGKGSRSTFVHLFINGEYWGIYNPSERPDQAFGASYHGDDRDEWDAMNSGIPCSGGSLETREALLASIPTFGTDEGYQKAQGNNPDGTRNTNYVVQLDVDNHIDYMINGYFHGTGDWGYWKNWYAGCPSRADENTGWKWWTWDAEASILGAYGVYADRTAFGGPMNIFLYLRENAEFRLRFADHVRRHFFDDGVMTAEAGRARYAAMADEVQPAMILHSARWGGAVTPATWNTTRNWILDSYFPQRVPVFLDQLRRCDLYPAIDAPAFSQYGGVVSTGFPLTITASNTVYVTLDGTDPREYLTGNPVGPPCTAPITLDRSTHVKARAHSALGEWSALTEAVFSMSNVVASLRLSEVMYHPAAPPPGVTNRVDDDYEFVELRNTGAETINLAYVRLGDAIRFTFGNLPLGPDQHVVVVHDLTAFAERYDTNEIAVAGEYAGRLANGGERIRLLGPNGQVLAAAEYNDGREWPAEADGPGHSLVPLVTDDQNAALHYGGNWRASAFIGGSPGHADPTPVRNVTINEFMAHTDYSNAAMPEYDSNDWLELFNAGDTEVSLDGWYLSDNPENLYKWAIPPTNTIVPGAMRVFDEITGFHSHITNGFGLDKNGESLFLSRLAGDHEDRVADCVRFKAQENHVTLGHYPDGQTGWSVLSPTPGGSNALAGPPTVLISEVMYHPPSTLRRPGDNTHDEYIEIANVSASPVALWNGCGPWRISGGVDYDFPPGTTLPPLTCLIVVSFDPALPVDLDEFLEAYALTNGEIRILGPFDGKLSNRGDRITLERGQAPDLPGDSMGWVIVDEVVYSDAAPWPPEADGAGYPLQRTDEAAPGANPAAWSGTLGDTPGLPRAKLTVASPQNGSVFLLPFALPVVASIDESLIVGNVRAVEFWRNGIRAAVCTNPPYETVWEESGTPADFTLTARLVDDAGTNLSRKVFCKTMRIDNSLPPLDVTDTSARLRGSLTGSGNTAVTVYWGEQDGGTNAEAWAGVKTLSTLGSGEFVFDLEGLDPDHTYRYRAFGRSAIGNTGWAGSTASFTTLSHRAWSTYMDIRFAGYTRPTALSNFPALVVLSTNIPGFRFSDFSHPATGSDLRFGDDTGLRALDFEIEEWNTNGACHVWVKIPRIASTNDFFRAYWGNPGASALPACNFDGAPWDESFRAVWHLNQDVADATAFKTEASEFGPATTQGIAGRGRSFDGTDDYITTEIHQRWFGQNLGHLTFSCWVNPGSTSPGSPFGTEDAAETNRFYVGSQRGAWRYAIKHAAANGPSIVPAAWQLLTLVLDDYQATGYWNEGHAVSLGTYPDMETPNGMVIGAIDANTLPFLGAIDEMRVSQVARPPDWIWAEYMTVASNNVFASYTIPAAQPFDPPRDIDHDQMADAWEMEHFHATNAPLGGAWDDFDGDGHFNIEEYWLGTVPTDRLDRFELSIALLTGGMARVSFFAREASGSNYSGMARTFDLQYCTNLSGGEWHAVPGYESLPGEDRPIVYTNSPVAPSPFLFRGRGRLTAP